MQEAPEHHQQCRSKIRAKRQCLFIVGQPFNIFIKNRRQKACQNEMTATAAFEHLRKYKIRNALLFSNRLEFLTQDYILLCFRCE